MKGQLTQLPPIARADAQILILGSMNSSDALKQKQYYAHYSNRFWSLMTEILGIPEKANDNYAIRIKALLNKKIALWSPIERCTRIDENGNLSNADNDIKNIEYADLRSFFEKHPDIRKILFNGQKAQSCYKAYQKKGGIHFDKKILRLQSTSRANEHFNKDVHKATAQWRDALLW